MNTYDFTGRVALVTGGASGIGAATAARLRAGGAEVAVFDREPVEGYVSLTGDIASSADVERRRRARRRRSSGGSTSSSTRPASPASRSARSTSPTRSGSACSRSTRTAASTCAGPSLPGMIERGYGRIVLVASIAGKEGNPMAAAYSACKAAVIAMTKAIGKDVAGTGVLVNCIAPGGDRDADPRRPLAAPHRLHGRADPARPDGEGGRGRRASPASSRARSCSFSTGATYDISGGRARY